MTDPQPIAPSLEDLSRANVENSRFFGYTDASGKVLALLSLGTLVSGATGLAQGLGYLGPILGLSLPLGVGFAVVGASIVAGLAGYWLGNFDDKHIKEHNQRANASRRVVRETIEQKFVDALAKVEYEPSRHSLPYDALGYAVMLPDDKIASLPDHVRLDIYRTQLDLELYTHKQLTCRNAVEGERLARAVKALSTTKQQADAYKVIRDEVRVNISEGKLTLTPITEDKKPQRTKEESNSTDDEVTYTIAEALADMSRAGGRYSRSSSSSPDIFQGGSGKFGGGGASGSWGVAAVPANNGSMSADFSSAARGGGFDFKMPDMDGEAAKGLVIVAAVAAAVAAIIVTGCSLWKNFPNRAEKPAFGNVHLPLITKSLASAEKNICAMYKR